MVKARLIFHPLKLADEHSIRIYSVRLFGRNLLLWINNIIILDARSNSDRADILMPKSWLLIDKASSYGTIYS